MELSTIALGTMMYSVAAFLFLNFNLSCLHVFGAGRRDQDQACPSQQLASSRYTGEERAKVDTRR
jgi:hypothetical protein